MRRGRRARAELVLTEPERDQLVSLARSYSMPAGLTQRAGIVLRCADGESNSEVASYFHVNRSTVGKWRTRFIDKRMAGLYDELRPGHARTISDERVAALIKTTLETLPANGATQWSVRQASAETGLSKSSVHRIYRTFGLKPHLADTFKLSTDPFFVEKLRDVVGLYLQPPQNALVLCLDEKSQCQALERTQPGLPMAIGRPATATHDYVRHGTTTLFAALNVASGEVIGECRAHHRHQEFLAFLRRLESTTPADLDLHVILDNYCTHKHARVKRWLDRHPRWHFHFVPTYSSWLNLVERFFAQLTTQALQRGSFTSVPDLIATIDRYVATYNQHRKPFVWTASADDILGKLTRLCQRVSGTGH